MTTLTFPTLSRHGPSAFAWRKISNTQTFESPFTGGVQTMVLPGARWACTARWDNLAADDRAKLLVFLASLRGTAGRFYFGNLGQPSPRGTALGTPLVNGASQTGATLATDGWTAGATLLAGDFIGYNAGAELRMVIADATANGSGQMSINLDEPIRVSPTTDTALVVVAPTCIMRLAGDEIGTDYMTGYSNFVLEAVEAFA